MKKMKFILAFYKEHYLIYAWWLTLAFFARLEIALLYTKQS